MAFPHDGKKFKPGESGNAKGRPKGIKNWSTIVQEVLESEELFEAAIEGAKRPGWIDKLPNKNGAFAIAVAMQKRALAGDKQAADWLRKTGFGDKIDMTTNGKDLPTPIMGGTSINPIPPTDDKE